MPAWHSQGTTYTYTHNKSYPVRGNSLFMNTKRMVSLVRCQKKYSNMNLYLNFNSRNLHPSSHNLRHIQFNIKIVLSSLWLANFNFFDVLRFVSYFWYCANYFLLVLYSSPTHTICDHWRHQNSLNLKQMRTE